MEITHEEGSDTSEKKNKIPSNYTSISEKSSKSVFGVRKNDCGYQNIRDDRDDGIMYEGPMEDSVHAETSEDINFYDAKGLDEVKGQTEKFFNHEEYAQDMLNNNNEHNLVHSDEMYNSYTDEELEKFFEDTENEVEGKNNNAVQLMMEDHLGGLADSAMLRDNTTLPKGDDTFLLKKEDSNVLKEDEYENFYNNEHSPLVVNCEERGMNPFDDYKEKDLEMSFRKDGVSIKSYEESFALGNKKLTLNTTNITEFRDLSNEPNDDFSFISNSSNSIIVRSAVLEEGKKSETNLNGNVENDEIDADCEGGSVTTVDVKNESEGGNKEIVKKKEKRKIEEKGVTYNEGDTLLRNNNLESNALDSVENDISENTFANNMNEEESNICDKNSIDEEKFNICDKNNVDEEESNICDKNNVDEEESKLESEKSKKMDILNYFENNEPQEDNTNNSNFLLKKKKIHEDQTSSLWYKHKRHFFIFTYSGKPVFTRYGNEENLTSFYGALLAIISKIESFSFSGSSTDVKTNKKCNETYTKNSLKCIMSKNTKVVYLDKEVLCLVCISKVNESTNYILHILNYMYFQIISLLTKSIDKSFQIKPSFDIRYLLDGADILMCNLISSCSKNMYSIFDGFEPLPLKQDYRNKINNLISSFKINNVLLSFLIINDKIIGISVSKYTINSMDIIILINMITSMKSFKNAESWTPICLPIYNPNLFLYAYINYIRKKICCVYVCSHASSRDFFHLSRHTSMIETILISSGCYDEIVKAADNSPFELPEIPSIEIIHVCYYIPYLKQYYSSKIGNDKVKRVFRVYQKCDDILRDSKLPAQIYLETEHEKFYCIKTNLYHLYLSVPFHVEVNDDNINEILKVIATYHKEIFINNIKQIT
ncbi:vacuolar fusion protein MON1 [Plasmodium gonderi]|uniref:Vacuolar fusion protein MON1 n=1 Tax=Plasmodium gonderi TaxID=77519 RepID=A0A1Y1JK57_PLAGO|nr:vacuolar fusion protein MON1 [Plasmodium gonderi]GAW82048.1 vacuolar fusion protein MON1 [Plasmodium gonderi]